MRSNLYNAENRPDGYIPDVRESYKRQLNNLMDMEDQNYYLGESGVRLFKDDSVETPISTRAVPVGAAESYVNIPSSLTSDRDKLVNEYGKSFG